MSQMKSLVELTDATDGAGGVGAWIPVDNYAPLILAGVVCYGDLSGVVTVLDYDMGAGNGNTIEVRYVSPRTHSCASTRACMGDNAVEGYGACLSATSNTFGTYPIQVSQWGDYDLLCSFAVWSAKGNTTQLIIDEMAKRLAKCRDAEIYAQLTDYHTGTDDINKIVTSDVSCSKGTLNGSCCSFSYNLYNSIVTLVGHMRSDCYDPDTIIVNPDVASFFYFKDGNGYPLAMMPGLTYDANGRLSTIMGLRVIETGVAHHCNDTGFGGASRGTGYAQAVVIDSKRAVGEVWGKRPTFETARVPECNADKLVVWQYWGAHYLDPLAIGWVVNP